MRLGPHAWGNGVIEVLIKCFKWLMQSSCLVTHFSFIHPLPDLFPGFYFWKVLSDLENSAGVGVVRGQWELFISLTLVIITLLDSSTYVPIQLPSEQHTLMTISKKKIKKKTLSAKVENSLTLKLSEL